MPAAVGVDSHAAIIPQPCRAPRRVAHPEGRDPGPHRRSWGGRWIDGDSLGLGNPGHTACVRTALLLQHLGEALGTKVGAEGILEQFDHLR